MVVINYLWFKFQDNHINILDDHERISATELFVFKEKGLPLVLIDVRSPAEFVMCSIPGSVNLPLKELSKLNSAADFQTKLQSDVELGNNILGK